MHRGSRSRDAADRAEQTYRAQPRANANAASLESAPAPTLEPTFSRRVFETRHSLVAALIGSGALLIPSTTLLASLDPAISEVVAMTGMTLVVASATVRTWAGLYIGGRKNQDVVRDGPYALARNPLYLGNLLATTGIVLLSGSLVVAALALPAIFLVFLFTIRSEEAKLSGKLGPAFTSYRATCRCSSHGRARSVVSSRTTAPRLSRTATSRANCGGVR